MADERIDIEIRDKVSTNVKTKILDIAKAARTADTALMKLKREMREIDGSALKKLSAESAKLTNAMARETSANARLINARARMQTANGRVAITEQKLKTEIERTSAAKSRAEAASTRASIATVRLQQAQQRLANSTKRSSQSLLLYARRARNVALASSLATAGVIRLADSYTLLQNRLTNLVESQEDVVTLTNELFSIANRTRQPVAETAKAFQRFDLALSDLGASQKETLRITETINKALTVSGASTQEAASALLQLSQAFNKGKLDGDELRSVMENIGPVFKQAIADIIAPGDRFNYVWGEQGRITIEVLREAFSNLAGEIDTKFSRILPTIGQSFVVLFNSLTKFFGRFDEATGLTTGLSRAIIGLAGALDTLSDLLGNVTFFDLSNGFEVLTSVISTSLKGLFDFAKSIVNNIVALFLGAYNTITEAWRLFPSALKDVFVTASNFAIDAVEVLVNGVLKGLNGLLDLANDAAKALGRNPVFDANFEVNLTALKGKVGTAAGELGSIAKTEFSEAFGTDFVGDAFNQLKVKRKELSGGREGLRGEGAAVGTVDSKVSPFAQLDKDLQKVNQQFEEGFLSADAYANKLTQLGLKSAELRLELGQGNFKDVIDTGLGQIVEGYDGVLSGLSDSFGSFFNSLSDGFADSIGQAIVYSEDLGDALRDVAQSALSEVISSLVKVGIQYAINAAIGQSIAATATAANAALGAATAAAWAPAAALVSLASFGANSAPASAGITATTALAKATALQGFESGGFTGNLGRKEIAGVVHGQEFVVNAEATARNRDTLEAMNRGAAGVSVNASSGKVNATQMNVYVENYTNGNIEVEQLSENEVRIIARDEAKAVVRKEAPDAVAASLTNPNSKVSKSLDKNTNATRRR